jgi:hypothetical protein
VNTVMYLRVLKGREFVDRVTVRFARTLLHGVKYSLEGVEGTMGTISIEKRPS